MDEEYVESIDEDFVESDNACESEYDNSLIELHNKQIKISDSERSTQSYINKYEIIRILCERTQQISDGSKPFINNYKKFTSAYEIACQEFKENKIPFIIMRTHPMGDKYELWKLSELTK